VDCPPPRFSIVTPSFNGVRWLPLCLASVADQEVPTEHLVQDGGSTDGTLEFLRHAPRPGVQVVSEPDRGMYDAVNRGLHRARGEFCAYLNCDEQYLPGTLRAVAEAFERHPGIEVLFADALVVDESGRYLCHRRALRPQRLHTLLAGNLAILTCATFFRREVFTERRLAFDPAWRALGDIDWVRRLLRARVPTMVLRRFTSAFTQTGGNLGWSEAGRVEMRRWHASIPRALRWLRAPVVAHYRLRKVALGLYRQAPFTYRLYTTASPDRRLPFTVTRPTARWHTPAPTP